MEDMEKTQMKFYRWKLNDLIEKKYSMDGIHNRLDIAKEKIRKHEEIAIETAKLNKETEGNNQ